MAASDGGRARLLVPIAAVLTLVWVAAGARAIFIGDVAPLVIASAPFGLLCGYLFGATIIRGER